MPKSKSPRKKQQGRKYNPATHAVIPGWIATTPERACQIKLIPHARLDAINEGIGTQYDLEVIKGRINTGYVLVTRHFVEPEATALMLSGLDVLRGVEARGEQYPRFIDREEFEILGEALNLTDDVQDKTTRREQADALQLVHATCRIPDYALSLLSV